MRILIDGLGATFELEGEVDLGTVQILRPKSNLAIEFLNNEFAND